MEYRTCEYCGAEYPASEPKCPECGGGSTKAEETAPKRRLASSAGVRAASGGKNGWRVASVVLGVLVVIGIVAFFVQMDFFREGGFDFDAIPTKIVWEDTTPAEQTPQEETPDAPAEAEPETETEPTPGACTGLTISKDHLLMDEEGGKVFLTAVARPRDCTDPIVFTSSDERVATVTENGMITAVGPGTAQILVSCGDIVEICQVECTFEASEPEPEEEKEPEQEPETEPEEETAPTLSKEDFTLFYPGEQYVLAVNDVPSGAAVSYVSSNTKVVTVEQDGTVTAKGEGDATITVTVSSVTLTAVARCRMDGSTEGGATGNYTGPFKISHEDVTLFSVGESFTLTLTDSTGKTVTGLSWKASNGAVTISGNTIKAAAAGQTTVSCVYNGETYSCIVRCTF